MAKKALLMILDGWGCGDHRKDDVIFNTPTPYWDSLLATYPHSQLQASGENVGLPDGQMGNSEVGHLNIGAGRIVYQDLVKINRACADGSILQNPQVVAAFTYAKEHGKNIHFMGLTSNGKAEIDEWNDLSMAAYPIYVMDDSELKMIARGNPAAVFLRNGEIVWKRAMQSIPIDRLATTDNFDDVIGSASSPLYSLYALTAVYLAAMTILLIVNRTHTVVKFSLLQVKKNRKKQVNLQSDKE